MVQLDKKSMGESLQQTELNHCVKIIPHFIFPWFPVKYRMSLVVVSGFALR